LSALGKYYSLKKPNKMRAVEVQRNVRQTFRAIGDRYSEAIALNALGEIFENLSDNKTAFAHYKNALKLFQDIDSLDGMTVSTCNIARMHYKLDKTHDQALRHYERCLSVCRAAGKHRSEAIALNEIAKVYAAQGNLELASKQYQRTQRIYKAIGDIRGQATALNAHGDFLLQSGKQTAALNAYSRSLPLAEQIGDQNILATTLYNLAHANLKLGSPELAHYFIQRSIRIIEDQRANLETPDFRLSYFSGVQNHYELQTQILMELNRLHSGQGFDIQALFASEKGRARLLRDLITESGADFRQGAPKELLDSEREIRGLIRSLAQYRMDLSLSQKGSAERAEVDNQMTELKTEYQEVLSRLRQHNPRLLSLVKSASLSLEQIQTELRDSDTMILEYDLGDERSYVWAITANSLHSYELSARKEIEDTAREVYKLITARQMLNEQPNNEPTDVKATDKLCFEKRRKLSQMLLGPLVEHLGNRRLVVITEGALQYIPFDALPAPVAQTAGPIESERASTALMETNEISALPSISALIAIRRAKKQVTSTSKLIAIIADPVFGRSDDRVQSATSSLSSALAATNHDPPETRAFARLIHASEEADAIAAKAPTGTTLVAKGFDANRETAMSSELSQYQILHFATHSFVDSEQPESSGIVLTMMDRNGVRMDGLMLLHDIYNLGLSSELTVLSACQTALGKDVNGEGLVGLNHSFLSAGSKSVIASLWKVDDQATAVLMAEFYDAMFQKGMSPATALRSAKLKMMRDPRRSAPFYWAGFVLQGEYNNHIAVDRYSWLRPRLVVLFLLTLSLLAASLFVVRTRKRRFSPPPSS
jgi:CHAT domain-containing protein